MLGMLHFFRRRFLLNRESDAWEPASVSCFGPFQSQRWKGSIALEPLPNGQFCAKSLKLHLYSNVTSDNLQNLGNLWSVLLSYGLFYIRVLILMRTTKLDTFRFVSIQIGVFFGESIVRMMLNISLWTTHTQRTSEVDCDRSPPLYIPNTPDDLLNRFIHLKLGSTEKSNMIGACLPMVCAFGCCIIAPY